MKTLIVFVQVCLKQSRLSRPLRVPWTAKRSNQSTLKEINSEYSWEGPMPKLQYFGHRMWRVDSLEKIGKIEGGRKSEELTHWKRLERLKVEGKGTKKGEMLDAITNSMDMSLSKLQEILKDRESLECCSPRGHKESDTTEPTTIHQKHQQHKGSLQTTKPDAMKSTQKGTKLEGAEVWWLETKQKTGLLIYWLHKLFSASSFLIHPHKLSPWSCYVDLI